MLSAEAARKLSHATPKKGLGRSAPYILELCKAAHSPKHALITELAGGNRLCRATKGAVWVVAFRMKDSGTASLQCCWLLDDPPWVVAHTPGYTT